MKKRSLFFLTAAFLLVSCGVTPRSSEPAPGTSEPAPSTAQSAPATSEPAPGTSESTPATSEPPAQTSEPAPETSEPAPETSEPAPETSEPAPATSEPAPTTSKPAPETSEPTPETSEPLSSEEEPVHRHRFIEKVSDPLPEHRHLVCQDCGYECEEGDEKEFVLIKDPSLIYNASAAVTNKMSESTVGETLSDFVAKKTGMYEFTEFENRLPEPSSNVKTLTEFVDVLDYHAFYGDSSVFTVTLDDDYHGDGCGIGMNAIHEAFYSTKLCVSVVGLNYGYDKATKTFTVQELFNPEANSYQASYASRLPISIPYGFESTAGNRASDFEDFPYLTKNTKGAIDVYNSEQLLYALEEGYLPLVKEGSPAEAVFEKAKQILRGIIKEDMDQFDKVMAIYSYIGSNNTYDAQGDDAAPFIVEEVDYPEYMASHFRSFFAEGGLLDGYCVCQGFAKSFNILATMEGMTSYKVSGRYSDDLRSICSNGYTMVDGEVTSATYESHGYSYVQSDIDGKFYLCDVTYAYHGGFYDSDYNIVYTYRSPAAMMPFDKWSELYDKVTDHWHNILDIGETDLDIPSHQKMGSLTARIARIEDLPDYIHALLEYLRAYDDPNYKTNQYFNINLFITEVDNNESLVSTLGNRLDQTMQSESYREYYWSYSYYSAANTGFLMVFKP